MSKTSLTHDRDVTTLTLEQREWIRRQGRLARALEAAQRASSRFVRSTTRPERAGSGGSSALSNFEGHLLPGGVVPGHMADQLVLAGLQVG